MPLDVDMTPRRAASVAETIEKGLKMRVKMLEERMAAPDGATVIRLEKDEVYDLPEDLATRYVERGRAELAEVEAIVEEPGEDDPAGERGSEEPASDPPRPARRRK